MSVLAPAKIPIASARETLEQKSVAGAAGLTIGIVVPVLDEAATLEGALQQLGRVAGAAPVVVVDGGSTDDSVRIASQYFQTEICPQANRSAQLNYGARFLSSDVLLFLHADSRLPDRFESCILRALRDPCVAGGCFQLQFDVYRPMLRFYCWFTQFPGRFFHFGDQAFFVRREAFQQIGGFRNLPFMEDVDFLRRLRGYGRFSVLPVPVVTSARRFLRRGIVRQQLLNVILVTLFELGVSAQRLARLYPVIR